MVKEILNRFWWNMNDFAYVTAFLVGVIICDIVMFAIWLAHNPLGGAVVCLVAALSCLITLKMATDNLDEEHKYLFYVYMLAAEILSGAIILHIAWWLINIPLIVSEYRKENPKRKPSKGKVKKCGC